MSKYAHMIERHRLEPASGFRFLQYLPPENSKADSVLIYLHGSGERGDDLSLVKRYGLPALMARSDVSVNCTVVCPQLEAGGEWDADRVALFIAATAGHARMKVLMGYSLGGSGVCNVVGRHGPVADLAVAIAGQAPGCVDAPQFGVRFFAIQGELAPWPCTNSFVASINAAGGVAESAILVGKAHYVSEEVLFHPGLRELLLEAGVEVVAR